MKKLLCLLLAAIMIFSAVAPALAIDAPVYVDVNGLSKIPVVAISGDGDPLYDEDGNRVLYYKAIINNAADTDTDSENIKESVMNVLYPFLVEGMLTNRWDNYYAALKKEVSDLFSESLLDNNGEATNGTDISPNRYNTNRYNMNTDKKRDGYYRYDDYYFFYDWRLDPLESADNLNEYIKAVKKTTGFDKIGILSRCLGTSVVMAYVAKYGMDDIIGVGFNGGVVNGAEVLSEPISGKFNLDAAALNRFLADCNARGLFNVDAFITSSIDLLDKNGMFDTAVGISKAAVYYRIAEGVTSALALSTFFTWPCYWAGVSSDDFDDAMYYVFGEEGSEMRTEYAGLIEKLENYNSVVRQHLPELFQSIADNGNICVMSKYGYQIGPICESCDEIGDQFASVNHSSYGATTSKVYNTLSNEYIAQRTALGYGKYISPDKQIDASTCQFPDNTWFIKGSSHSTWSFTENSLLLAVITADRQLTVDDIAYTQYMVYDYDTSMAYPMTEENCDTYNWTAEKTEMPFYIVKKIIAAFKAFVTWLKELSAVIQKLLPAAQETTVLYNG